MPELIIQSDNYQLACLVEGEGLETLVIGSAIYYPLVFSATLRERLKMAFVDHRGFAPVSPQAEDPQVAYGMDVLVEDVERARLALGWDRMVLVGHSGHSAIALAYAKRYPEHVSHLVLLNAGPNNDAANMASLERDWEELVSPARKAHWALEMGNIEARVAADPSRAFVAFMMAMGARSFADYAYDAGPLWTDVPVNPQAVDHMWGVVFRDIDIAPELDRLTMPVFLGVGTEDYLVPPLRTWEPYRGAFANLTVRSFERSGHTPSLESPEAFDAALLTWLEVGGK